MNKPILQVLLPVSVSVLAAISKGITDMTDENGTTAIMRQEGIYLSFYEKEVESK